MEIKIKERTLTISQTEMITIIGNLLIDLDDNLIIENELNDCTSLNDKEIKALMREFEEEWTDKEKINFFYEMIKVAHEYYNK
jgi:hypothetical protein